MGKHGPYYDLAEQHTEIDRLRAELAAMSEAYNKRLAEALHFKHQCELGSAELAEANARIAELEDHAVLVTLAKNNDQLRARIAGLEALVADQKAATDEEFQNCSKIEAELAEANARIAELEAVRPTSPLDVATERLFPGAVASMRLVQERDEADARAERAEAELKAMREVLDWIYGFLAYVDSYHSRMIRDKVRAALAPSPADEK